MVKIIVIVLAACCLSGCLQQRVNPGWQEGNLSKQEHLRRRLERLESEQMGTEMLKDIVSPEWGQ